MTVGVLLTSLYAPQARAGFAVQPSDGSTVTTGSPTFLVYVDNGDTLPEVVVSTAPDHNDYGFTGSYVGSCYPTTPFGEPYKYTCQLPSYETPLAPGTYYWGYTFEATVNVCQSLLGTQECFPETQAQFSGPFKFTVAQPVAPQGAGLVGPADGATVGTMPTLTVSAPASSSIEIYASLTTPLSDGTAVAPAFSCSGSTTIAGNYTCSPDNSGELIPGMTYYWWAVIAVDGNRWIYGPRTFVVRTTPVGGGGGSGNGGGSGSASAGPHSLSDAPQLPRSSHFTGGSIQDVRLSRAAYTLSKYIGAPKMVAVACWSSDDWNNIGGTATDGLYTTLAFWSPLLPRWINLSPAICRGIETLLYHRPATPNAQLANAVETVTHEMMHALGITRQRYGMTAEAMAECYGMQLSIVMASTLGVPYAFNKKLAHLNLVNYLRRPPSYQNFANCREGGAWDLFPQIPSPPWHDFGT